MKRGESMRSRGYTLIEIAGVMVVLGLLLGASLWPLDRQLRESEYRQERAQLERLRDAVLGYALRHRTPGVEVIMVNDDGIPVQPGFYAPGRPYLPCPDHTFDGIADRSDLIKSVTQTLSRTVPPENYTTRLNSPFLYNGACHASKGQLPWRTLGSIPADYWGNRYTYFADTAFSTETTGFDEKTIADSGERRWPRVRSALGADIPLRRQGLNIIEGSRTDGRPSIICPAAVVDADAAPEDFMCGQDGTIAAPATVVAGEPAPIDGNPFAYPRDNRGLPDIADGLPFVIISHGHNGFGAVNHLLARRGGRLECHRSFADENTHGHERANAHIYVTKSNMGDIIAGPCDAFSVLDDPPHRDPPPLPRDRQFIRSPEFNLSRRGYFFAHRSDVSAARAASSLSDQTGLDDLLVWMTRGDLARRLREADVFPLIVNDSDRPPVFSEPE